MRYQLLSVAGLVLLTGCSYVDAYEEAVRGFESVYCYKSIGSVECYREPKHEDERRMVNYFGKHPSRYDAPEKAEAPKLTAPPPVDFWVKDAEPVPEPRVRLADLSKQNFTETTANAE